MLIVKVKDGKIDSALKELKRKVKNTKQIEELRARKEFRKKSDGKRQQIKTAVYRENKRKKDEFIQKT